MKRLVTVMVFLVALVLLSGVPEADAGPVMGGGADSEKSLKDKPDTKPVKCIGLVNMSNGMVLPEGKVTGSIKYRYMHKDSLYDGSQEKHGNYGGKYDRVNHSVQLTAKAGLFEDFEARVMVPFWDKTVDRKYGNPPMAGESDHVQGLGISCLWGGMPS